eukprot:m.181482 g.181482  ORF g.181482 m.181482 type:complete len:171 (+) comp39273_c0_seq4:454-966(+)
MQALILHEMLTESSRTNVVKKIKALSVVKWKRSSFAPMVAASTVSKAAGKATCLIEISKRTSSIDMKVARKLRERKRKKERSNLIQIQCQCLLVLVFLAQWSMECQGPTSITQSWDIRRKSCYEVQCLEWLPCRLTTWLDRVAPFHRLSLCRVLGLELHDHFIRRNIHTV